MGGIDKLFAEIDGRPVLYHTLAAFEACDQIDRIVLVLSLDGAERALRMLETSGFRKVTGTCRGGDRRQDSVRAGLEALRACDWVVVHDGARPLVTPDLIRQGIEAAQATGASTAAMPVVETLKEVASEGTVLWTVSREHIWAVQTPQVFRYSVLLTAHERQDLEATDDAGLVERTGGRVRVYHGTAANLKITTPDDLAIAAALLRARWAGSVGPIDPDGGVRMPAEAPPHKLVRAAHGRLLDRDLAGDSPRQSERNSCPFPEHDRRCDRPDATSPPGWWSVALHEDIAFRSMLLVLDHQGHASVRELLFEGALCWTHGLRACGRGSCGRGRV